MLELPHVPTALLYVLSGRLRINHEHVVEPRRMVVFGPSGAGVHIEVEESGSLLVLAGEPLTEPMGQYGPFVMTTEDEIREAFRDYQQGAMGQL